MAFWRCASGNDESELVLVRVRYMCWRSGDVVVRCLLGSSYSEVWHAEEAIIVRNTTGEQRPCKRFSTGYAICAEWQVVLAGLLVWVLKVDLLRQYR